MKKYTAATTGKGEFKLYANSKVSDQPALPRSLIGAFAFGTH